MGKSTIYTISMAIFNSRLYVYQRLSPECLSIPHFSGGGNAATDSGTAGHTSAGIPRLSQVAVEDSHQSVSIITDDAGVGNWPILGILNITL
jgi:hypothetical protein